MDPNKAQADSPSAEENAVQPGVSADSPPADVNVDSSPQESSREAITDSGAEYESGLLAAINEAIPDDGFEEDESPRAASEGSVDPDQAQTDEGESEGEESAEAAEAESETETDGADKADEEHEDEQADENLPFGKHPRFKQLINERNEYRNMAEEYRPHAEEFQKIESFMQRNQLSNEEVAQGFQIMALMKNDPFAAREQLVRHLQVLDQVTGNGGLPNDLQQDVARGYVTEARAREIARLRANGQFQQQRSQLEQAQQQQMLQQERQARAVEAQKTALNDWESKVASRDPDYNSMKDWVAKELQLLAIRERPQTPDDAVRLAKQAYDNVKQGFRRFKPQRQTVQPKADSNSTGNVAGGAQPEPKSFLDAVMQAADL